MQEVIEQVLGYARGAWRFRWLMFLIAWPVALGGWFYVTQVPDEYRASARVFVDTRSLLNPMLRGLAIQTNIGSEISLITKTIYSRPNLEKIARMTDRDLEAKTDADMERILQELKGKLRLGSGRGDNLYNISYIDKDPQLAKATVQSLLTIFVESTLGGKRKDSNSAQKFIDEQIRSYEQKLIAAEDKLRDFKRRNLGMSGSVEAHFQKLVAAKAELRGIELTKEEAVQRRDELLRQLKDIEEGDADEEDMDFGIGAIGGGSSIYDSRIQQLESQKEELLIRFTKKHPSVVSIDRTIASLKKRRNEEMQSTTEKLDPDVEASPVYQQTKLLLGEADANLASLNVREKEYKKRVKGLEKLIETMPQIETELKRLNRDYSVNKRNYDALIARRESAKLGEEAQQSGDTLKFRVIDPPFVGNKPAAPNRPVMMSVVFVGALIAGLAFPVFISLLRPCVDSVKSLQNFSGLPVIGGVSLIQTKPQLVRRRVEMLSFLSMFGLLLAAYAGVMTMTIMGKL